MPDAPLLAARGLRVTVGGHTVCAELEMACEAGRCVAILGRNGSGKTTLLHTLAGLRPPAAGTVALAGSDLATLGPRQIALTRGLLVQQQSDPFAATVLDTVLVGRHPHLGRWAWESAEDEHIARAALADLGLADLAARDIQTLSGGERQRVALAALLAQAPRRFLLDEPLNHLDLHYQIAALELFRHLAGQGRGVVMVLHDINLAARYADQVVLLDGQGGAAVGPRDAVMQAERLSRAFGHPLRRFEVEGRVTFLPD